MRRYCQACAMLMAGVKTKIPLEHECGLERGATPQVPRQSIHDELKKMNKPPLGYASLHQCIAVVEIELKEEPLTDERKLFLKSILHYLELHDSITS